jgi:hypothetical protein
MTLGALGCVASRRTPLLLHRSIFHENEYEGHIPSLLLCVSYRRRQWPAGAPMRLPCQCTYLF